MYTGPWVMVHKPVDSRERAAEDGLPPVTRIHDDDTARALGFQAGIVGGLTLLSVTTGAIAASLGQRWYEGGVLSVRHRNVTYEGEVRVVWDQAPAESGEERRIAFYLERRDGSTSTYGWAAAAAPGVRPVAPWEKNPVSHQSAGQDAVPEMTVGHKSTPFQMTVRREDAVKRLDEINENNWWHRFASPWGGPVLTPFDIAFALYQGRTRDGLIGASRSSRLRTSMDAGTDLVVYQPMFLERPYVMTPTLCAKWQTNRTFFFDTEYTYDDVSTGKRVAIMRAHSAHLLRDLAPAVL